jgi:hypothetical protein
MTQEVIDALALKTQPDDVGKLLNHCKDLVKLSRDEMARYYNNWDRNDRVYRGEKIADEEDKQAAKRKAPQKFVMPVSYAQINTFVSFLLAVLNQRDYFFELGGSGVEDEKAGKVAQAVLEHNIEYNNFRHQKLKQFATDLAKYGVGVFKHTWRKEKKFVTTLQPKQIPVPIGMVAPPPEMVPVKKEVTKYLGNVVVTVSPYRFFPDPRLPLTRFNEGEFCASEDEYSRSQMAQFQRDGIAAGVEDIPNLTDDAMENRRRFSWQGSETKALTGSDRKPFVILTEVQVYLNPTKWTVNEKPLGTEDYDCLYLVWVANDSRIVRLEPCDYPHQSFTYDVAQFEEDQINFINEGMADKLGPLQDVIDWLINSRITNVRKVIGNQLIVDPKGIEIQDLRDRKPVLRLKPAVQGMGVDKWIKQLPLQDVTTTHLSDVEFLNGYAKQTTGITENLLGQFATGRRSAQEAKNVNNNATARIMGIVNSVWNSALLPLGRKMLDNLRAGLDEPTVVRIFGELNSVLNREGVFRFLNVTPEMLVGNYDFLVFDGTLPSQRASTAQALQELLSVMGAKPELIPIFGYDPQLLMAEILNLRGVRNAEQYKLDPTKAGQFAQLAQVSRNAMGATGGTGANGGQNVGGA